MLYLACSAICLRQRSRLLQLVTRKWKGLTQFDSLQTNYRKSWGFTSQPTGFFPETYPFNWFWELKCWNLPALSRQTFVCLVPWHRHVLWFWNVYGNMLNMCSAIHTHTYIYTYKYTHSHTLLFILCVACLEQNHVYYHARQYVVYLCKSSTGAHEWWQLFFIGGIECNSTINQHSKVVHHFPGTDSECTLQSTNIAMESHITSPGSNR